MSHPAVTATPLHPLLAERWSPRGFDPTHRLAPATLTALLEAARWSPSAGNSQPWRFVVAERGGAAFGRLVGTLSGNNRRWAGRASALLVVLAETTDPEGRPRAYGLYDTGQAVAHLVTQAQAEGLATHQMGGFDQAAVVAQFGIDPRFTPVVVIAIGVRQEQHGLPDDLAVREAAPRERLPLADLLLTAPATDLRRTA
jgi:nitroreductase